MTLKADSWEEELEIQVADLEKIYAVCATIAFIVGILVGLVLSSVLSIPTLAEILRMYEISVVYLGD